jgi:hypothetical protein
LKDLSPSEVLGDVMIEDQYNDDDDDDDDEVVKEEDKKKKSVAFKVGTSSSKNKSKGKARRKIQVMRSAPMMIVMMKL